MKISKIIFSLILSAILFNNSMAMEPDSDDEESYNANADSENSIKFEKDHVARFELFIQLPKELQFMILYFDLTSIPTGRAIRRRAQTLSMISTLIKNGLGQFKHEEIWTRLLSAEEYVKENSATSIRQLIYSAARNILNILDS